jgi:hypothetical protein
VLLALPGLARWMRFQKFDGVGDRAFGPFDFQIGVFMVFSLELRTFPRNRQHIRGGSEHQAHPCFAPV